MARRWRRVAAFASVYSASLFVAYSAFPYKTPWLAMGIVQGLALLGGCAWRVADRLSPPSARAAALALGGAGLVWMTAQTAAACGPLCADTRNPFAYAQAVPDVRRLAWHIEAAARHHRDGRNMEVAVFASDYWPMPWYLRAMPRVGWWNAAVGAGRGAPPVVVADIAAGDMVGAQLGAGYVRSFYGLRPEVPLVVFTEAALAARVAAAPGGRTP
jgi:hypothetical protein